MNEGIVSQIKNQKSYTAILTKEILEQTIKDIMFKDTEQYIIGFDQYGAIYGTRKKKAPIVIMVGKRGIKEIKRHTKKLDIKYHIKVMRWKKRHNQIK